MGRRSRGLRAGCVRGCALSLVARNKAGEAYLQRIREHVAGGKRSGVRGTPGFFVNGRSQDVSLGLHALFDATEEVLRRLRKGKAPPSLG